MLTDKLVEENGRYRDGVRVTSADRCDVALDRAMSLRHRLWRNVTESAATPEHAPSRPALQSHLPGLLSVSQPDRPRMRPTTSEECGPGWLQERKAYPDAGNRPGGQGRAASLHSGDRTCSCGQAAGQDARAWPDDGGRGGLGDRAGAHARCDRSGARPSHDCTKVTRPAARAGPGGHPLHPAPDAQGQAPQAGPDSSIFRTISSRSATAFRKSR